MSDQAPTPETQNGASAAPQPVIMPNTMPIVAADPQTQALIDRATKGGMNIDLAREAFAGAAAVATDTPMRPENMTERLNAVAAADPARVQGFFRPPNQAAPATQSPAAPPVEISPEQRVRQSIAILNRARARPQGFYLPAEEYARRIHLAIEYRGTERYGEDHLIPPESAILLVGRAPEGSVFELAELRKLQLHPFALDRLLVAEVSIDGVTIAGQSPATVYGRSDGAPTGVLAVFSEISVRIRNLTKGPVPLAISIQVVPLEREG